MKRFTILLFLVLCTVFSLQAQNVTLPYTQDFAALSQGDMNSDTGSPTPVSAGALQGIASLTGAYQAGGAIRLGDVGNVGGFTTQPVVTSGAGYVKVSFKAAAWIAATPSPAQVVVGYGSQTVTVNIPATAHVWPIVANDMNTYNVQFQAEATHSAVSITTVSATGNETRIFLDDLKLFHKAGAPAILSEGFEGTTFPPSGWTALHISGTKKWERSTYNSPIGTACAKVSFENPRHHNWLITPSMAPKAGDSLTFKVKTPSYYSNTRLYIRISTSSKDTSSFGAPVKTLSTASEIPTTWKKYSIDLSSYAGSSNVYVAFQVIDNNGLSLLLDDIHGAMIFPNSDCVVPYGLQIRNITTTGADISWSGDGYASSWVVEYSTQSTFAGATQQTVTGTPSLSLSGLTPDTKYYVRVKSDCLLGEYSEWSGVATFDTRCLPLAGPINILEDFNSLNTKEIPVCWSKITTDKTYPSVVTSPGYGLNSKAIKFADSFHQYLIMQPVGVALNTLQLDFLLAREGKSSGTFQVGYMTDPNDSNTFVAVASFNDKIYKKLHKRVYFTDVVDNGSNRYITFRYGRVGDETFATNWYYWIDSVTVKAAPSCRLEKDTLELVRVVPDSAIIKYKLPAGYTSVEYVYGVDSVNDPATLTTTIATGGQIAVGNLSPETMYKLWIRVGCSGGIYSDWSAEPITFKTPCAYINTLDENFDSLEVGSLPHCWSKISTSYSYPKIKERSPIDGLPTQSIPFGLSNPQYLVLPQFGVALNTLKLDFSLRRFDKLSGTFQVGYMTDPTDSNTFVAVASFNDNRPNLYKKWLKKSVYFTSVADNNGTNRYIAFRYGKVGNEDFSFYSYYFIDSISVQAAPTCQPPYNIANTFVSTDSAVIGYKRPATALSVQYVFIEYDTITAPSTLTPIQNTGDTIKLSGLGSNKTYKLWLRSDCGAGSVSDWADPITFTTICNVVDSIDEDFDSIPTSTLPDCWSKITKKASGYPYVVSENIGYGEGNMTIKFGSSYPQFLISPRIGVALNTLKLDFSLYKEGIKSGTFQVGYMTDPTDSTTFVPVASFSDKSMFALKTMLKKSVFFKQVVDNGNNRYIAFRYGRVGNEEFSTSSYYWLDSVKLQATALACVPPYDLVNTYATTDSAVIVYKKPIGTTATRYVYAEETSSDDPSTLTAHTVTSDTIKLSGLTPNYTSYKIWMQSSCGAGTDSEWSTPLIFNTECGEYTTLSENFDRVPEGSIHGCWSKISTENSFPSVVKADASAGLDSKAIKFSSSFNQYLISPRFSVPLNTLELNFSLDREGEESGIFRVGYMTDPTDKNTFVEVASFNDDDEIFYKKMLRKKVYFTDVDDNGTNRYIAFKYNPQSTVWYYWLDSVEVVAAPTCMPPSQFKIDSISTDSVVITYKLRAAATGYEYAYGDINETDPSNLTPIATGDTIKLGGLTPHTRYRLWARTQCGAGTYSDWSLTSIAFTTRCQDIHAVNEDFEAVAKDSIPECWSKKSASYSYPSVVNASAADGVTSKAMKFYGVHPQYLILSKIDTALNRLQLRFDLNKESKDCGIFQVGYMTKPTDGSTFVPVASFNDNVYKKMLPKVAYFDTVADSSKKRYIAFRYGAVGAVTQSTSKAYWVDNVVLEPADSCMAPTSLMANVAKDSVKVAFEHRPSATSWQYVLAKNVPLSTTPPDSITPTAIVSDNIVIKNIEPNQDYTVWVRTTSCTNDTSAWAVTIFTTKYCTASPNKVDGKGIVNVTYGMYNIVDNTTAAEAGNYGDYTALSGDIVAGDSAYVSITLSTEKSYKTRVYVDWNQDYDFEGTGEFVYNGTTGSNKTETLLASFLVPSYVRAGNYRMRIVSTPDTPDPCFSGSKGAVEDYTLTFGTVPTCRPTEAKSISVSNITSNSADISWKPSGSGTSWEVIVSPDPLTATQLKNYTSAINVTDSSYNATGLRGNKDYYVYVRSVCSATDKSYWTWWRPFEFMTKPTVVSTPYYQDFTNVDLTELFVFPGKKVRENKWCLGSGISNGGNSMYISKNGVDAEYANIVSRTLSYITIDFDNSPKFEIYFDWIGKGESSFDFMRVYVVPDTLTLPTTWKNSEKRWIKDSVVALQLGDKFNGKTEWTTFSDTLPSSYAGTRRKLVFMWFNDGGLAGSPTMAVDNIYVGGYECKSPSRFVVDTVTRDSAQISWSKGSTETSWIVEYKKLDDNTWVRDTVNDTTYSLNHLESYTEYKIRIRGICPGGSGHTGLLLGSLRTLCGDKAIGNGIVYNFDDAIGSIPTCWTRTTPFTYKGLTFPLVGNYTDAPKDGVILFSGRSTQILALQEYRENVKTLELEFDLLRESTNCSGQLEVGVMSDPNNANTFVPIHNLTSLIVLPDKYLQYTRVSMDTALAEGKHYIAFRQVVNSPTSDTLKYGIDNLDIHPIPMCKKPNYNDIRVTLNEYTPTVADVSWIPGGYENTWEVQYKDVDSTEWKSVIVTQTSMCILQRLMPQTTYEVRLRSICTPDTSKWTRTYRFTTLCDVYTLPYTENFKGMSFKNSCWSRYEGLASAAFSGQKPKAIASGWIPTTTNSLDTAHIKVNIWGTSCKYWAVSPLIKLNENSMLQFDMSLTRYGSSDTATGTRDDDQFMVIVSTDGGNTWLKSNATIWNNSNTDPGKYVYNNIRRSGEKVSIDLSMYADSTVRIAFYGESTSNVSNGDNDLHIDNIRIFERVIVPPKVKTLTASNIGENTATLNKDVTPGDIVISKEGFYYKPAGQGAIWTLVESDDDAFVVSGLIRGTVYKYIAYATLENNVTFYGDTVEFTTTGIPPVHPTVSTLAATNISQNSATMNKSVTSDPSEPVTEQGWKWRKVGEPNWIVSMNGNLTSLEHNTQYEFFAFAKTALKNQEGYQGQTLTFTTTSHIPPTVKTLAATAIGMYGASLRKSVTAGSEPIVEEGWEYKRVGEVVWTNTKNANINNLAQDTEYEFYAYAVTNSYPMTKGETLKFRTLKATSDLDAADYGVNIYPNPADNVVTLAVEGLSSEAEVTIIDMMGRKVGHYLIAQGSNSITIDVSPLAEGTYAVRIVSDNATIVERLVIKKR